MYSAWSFSQSHLHFINMRWSIKHHNLSAHHRYQLEVVLLFAVGFFLYIPYFIFMEEYNLEMQVWQWYFFWPWMIFYILYSLNTRRKIRQEARISPLRRPIAHWVLLGVSLIALHIQPTDLEKLQSVDLMFIIFSLFMADSYWDFRKKQNYAKKLGRT